ncbi:type I-F CRISPR-associated protein Csy2 [Advenella alkanexedens]|uniref:Type I-F CRISPR-associated protein Csy2 n=1 Tax=Advenella alkanexedens TaxID=1481665 RepID=A0ABS6NNB2_9BURK|nr:type I-F CRISPR-associated protein Csy2 [Advenella alkanexedens]MBV4397105.1 type I-F CRISPR-associated protein Csy2 [Advenella alkanexedens]
MSYLSNYLVLNKIRIQNANAISSPLTYGFPAISGFIGAIHALNRKIKNIFPGIRLDGTLIACHEYHLHAYRPYNSADYTFNLTRNPIKKDGKTAAIVEEGRIDLTVSLVIEVFDDIDLSDNDALQQKLIDYVQKQMMQQRLASGSVMHIQKASLVPAYGEEGISPIINSLIPAFVLMDAAQELVDITNELKAKHPDATPLDALIETATLHHVPETDSDEPEATQWKTKSIKTGRGWIVPIAVGYQGIYEPFTCGELENCRTSEYPSQYVECIYSLGKWVFPYRIEDNFNSAFWRFKQPENNLYLISQSEY